MFVIPDESPIEGGADGAAGAAGAEPTFKILVSASGRSSDVVDAGVFMIILSID
jgi:hypothetical protein